MPAEAPAIDPRTYRDLVEELEALVEQETTVEVAARAKLLKGVFLAQDVDDPSDGSCIADRDTLVGAALAEEIESLEPGPVKVTLWHPWILIAPGDEDLAGAVLAEDLFQPGSDPPLKLAKRGARVDELLAQKIRDLPGLESVKIARADAAGSLIRIGGRLAALVIERLNKLPEKCFLAFLDLIGGRLAPPLPARVPLTFQLAAGSSVDALVPAGTQVAAAPAEGQDESVVFETEQDLVVSRSKLVAAFVREPGHHGYREVTKLATGEIEGSFAVFLDRSPGTLPKTYKPIGHRIYVGSKLLETAVLKAVRLELRPPAADPGIWPLPMAWSRGDAGGWKELSAAKAGTSWSWPQVPAIPRTTAGADSEQLNPGKKAAWLRGELDLSGTGVPAVWKRTELDDVRLTIELADFSLAPELAFANQLPIDPTTDFFPFGERPRVGDAFYLASDAAFARAGAEIDLEVALTELYYDDDGNPQDPNASESPALELAWEYWNGKRWTSVLESDSLGNAARVEPDSLGNEPSTLQLVEGGTVSFECPNDWQATEVNGEEHYWLRVRIARGNYGVEARYEEAGTLVLDSLGNAVPYYQLTESTLRPPSISSLSIGYELKPEEKSPDVVLTENDFVFDEVNGDGETDADSAGYKPGTDFEPFAGSVDTRPTLYLGFERPGAGTGFANRSVALFLATVETPYDSKQQAASGGEAEVVWEYWDGDGFKALDVSDETRGLTRRGLVTFTGPSDFRQRRDFGRRAFWLRARWQSGGYAAPPELEWISTATTWASHRGTLAGEVLGGSTGEPDQLFTTAQKPVLDGQQLEVREPETPSAEELKALEAEVGSAAVSTVLDDAGRPKEIWVRWHEVLDFYASDPRSRHYTLDRLTGEVRFGDGRRGLVPPAGRSNVRMARYRTGGGPEGNLAAKTLVQLKGAVPYVDAVVNQVPAAGGAGRESLAEARRRAPRSLRHRGRAVAGADFEDLALEASPEVARARAIVARDRNSAGSVELMVVPKSTKAQPVPSLGLLERVEDYVGARMTPTTSLWLAGPDWIGIKVEAEIVPRQLRAANEVQGAARRALEAFLHPLTGGPDSEGWPFGRKPERSELLAVLASTPGVDHVRRMSVTTEGDEELADRFLIHSGDHLITLAGGGTAGSAG